VSAADRWSKARGHTPVHRALSTSVPRAPRAESPQMHHRSSHTTLVSVSGNPPHTGRASISQTGGQEAHGAPAPSSGVATCSTTSPKPDQARERTFGRMPRGRCTPDGASGEGTLTRPLPRQEGLGGSPTARVRGVSEAALPLYSRAGRGCEWASTACCRSLPLHTSWHPRPLCSSVCVFLCCLRPPRCVSTGPVVVRLAGMAILRERERGIDDSERTPLWLST
jgi:hypothetical protein